MAVCCVISMGYKIPCSTPGYVVDNDNRCAYGVSMTTRKLYKPKRDRKIDVAKALQMRVRNGMNDADIALYFGVGRSAVNQALSRFNKLLLKDGQLQAYQENKGKILESVEAKLLSEMVDPDRVKKASLNNVAYAVAQVSNMTRLEKGQSTSNIAYMDMSASLEEIKQQRKQLEETLEGM